MRPRFCIDEAGFTLEPTADDPAEVLQRFLDLLDRCRQDGQEVRRWSELETIMVLPDVPLWAVLYGDLGTWALDRDLRRSLQQTLDRCRPWDDAEASVQPRALVVGGQAGTFRTLAYVLSENQAKRAVACIDLQRHRSGARTVADAAQNQLVHFVSEEGDKLLAFYREVPEIEGHDPAAYLQHAAIAFPSLHLLPELEQEFNAFAGPYSAVRSEVSRNLGMLNDHFREVFQRNKNQPHPTALEMKARFDVTMSKESTNTRANKKAARERLVLVDGVELSCKWHCKLTWSENRIHFHPGSPTVADGRIVIGRFARHLTT